MIFIQKRKLQFVLPFLISVFYLYAQSVYAQSTGIKTDQQEKDINEYGQKIIQYNNEAIELELKIKHAELEVKRLLAVKSPAEEFDAKNEAIGLKYEIIDWQKDLKNIRATIVELEKINKIQIKEAQNATYSPKEDSLDKNKSDNNHVEKPLLPSVEMIAEIRKRQHVLIHESYTMEPADAALNLAKAKALEPLLTAPVLGEKSALGSFFPASSTTRYNGMMIHLGGNQYMLEAYLRPGKQEFIVGNMRFMRIVPVQYDGVLSLVLLDAQDAAKPVLEYFAK